MLTLPFVCTTTHGPRYEGGEDNPSFAAVVDTLVLPLQLATDNPSIIRASGFLKEWMSLLEAFCHRAALITPGNK